MAKPIEVTKDNPCAHCGKPDWCYRLEPLSVCNRDADPAPGWYKTSKTDDEGHYYYAPINEKTSPSINIRKSKRRSPLVRPSSLPKESRAVIPYGSWAYQPPPISAVLGNGSHRIPKIWREPK